MRLGQQIKKYRIQCHLSQEQLAKSVYVSRQTVSNWETEKNIPDIHSLVLLSQVFEISMDTLVKGDLEEMRAEVKQSELKKFNKDGYIFAFMLCMMTISFVPLIKLWHYLGFGLWLIITGMTFYYCHRVEKQKKQYDIQSYKEILLFMDGYTLTEIEKQQEKDKRPYQMALYVLGSSLIGFTVSMLMMYIFDKLLV